MKRKEKIRAFKFIKEGIKNKDWPQVRGHVQALEKGLGLDSDTLRLRYWERQFFLAGRGDRFIVKNQLDKTFSFSSEDKAKKFILRENKRLKKHYLQYSLDKS